MSNIFTCVGTVVRDAETRFLPSGQAVANVTIANNQGFNDKQTSLFIRCAIWGKKAESGLIPLLVKGQQVMVSGELTQSTYNKDGQEKTQLELNTTVLDLVGKKGDSGQQQQSAPRQSAQQQKDEADFSDEIPF